MSGKDKNNIDDVPPQRSPRMTRSKARLGGGDTHGFNEAENSPVSNEKTKRDRDFGDGTRQSPYPSKETEKGPDSGEETEKSPDSGEETEKSPETGEETEKSPETGDETETSPDTDDETETSPISAHEAMKRSISAHEAMKSPISHCKTEKSLVTDHKTEKSPIPADETDKSPCSFKGQNSFTVGSYILAALVGVLAVWYFIFSSLPVQKDFSLLKVFSHEMDKVQARFPSQHRELWRRSRIHLQKHLNLTNPSEPVSVILTSGRGAEKTLGCLARHMATAFSTALNSSVVGIDGTSKRAQDSDQVKLDIDRELREAFEGGTQAAVIHRFDELPPGSTLIFYRYCDHENAAYKKVFLAFTVMLQEELEVPPNVSLGLVEEMVQEYLQEKFVSSDRTAKFNQMDVDKLSGLWSRISHVILPVAAEQTIEQKGCAMSG